ncbi:MAG: DUF2147 domain-containing protein [Betaproteobacteria bacterium]
MLTLEPVLAALALLAATAVQAAPDRVCGRWLTEDKQGTVHVYFEADGKLAGRIVAGSGPNERDDKNPDPAQRGRPLLGLKLMQGFSRDGDGWRGGEIYDPDEGKTYKATARLSDKDANRLLLRGYVGVPMFGRTEEWTREPAPAGDPCRDPGAG